MRELNFEHHKSKAWQNQDSSPRDEALKELIGAASHIRNAEMSRRMKEALLQMSVGLMPHADRPGPANQNHHVPGLGMVKMLKEDETQYLYFTVPGEAGVRVCSTLNVSRKFLSDTQFLMLIGALALQTLAAEDGEADSDALEALGLPPVHLQDLLATETAMIKYRTWNLHHAVHGQTKTRMLRVSPRLVLIDSGRCGILFSSEEKNIQAYAINAQTYQDHFQDIQETHAKYERERKEAEIQFNAQVEKRQAAFEQELLEREEQVKHKAEQLARAQKYAQFPEEEEED